MPVGPTTRPRNIVPIVNLRPDLPKINSTFSDCGGQQICGRHAGQKIFRKSNSEMTMRSNSMFCLFFVCLVCFAR